jgi:hypothetical protein
MVDFIILVLVQVDVLKRFASNVHSGSCIMLFFHSVYCQVYIYIYMKDFVHNSTNCFTSSMVKQVHAGRQAGSAGRQAGRQAAQAGSAGRQAGNASRLTRLLTGRRIIWLVMQQQQQQQPNLIDIVSIWGSTYS